MLADFWARLIRRLTAAALFASIACGSSRKDDVIVVPGDVNHEALHALQRARGRHLTREEMLELHRVWIEDEILYREGLKLEPSAGAATSREKVTARALGAIDQKVRATSVSDEELRLWFEGHRDAYEQPARFDFEDAATPGRSTEAAIRALVTRLNGGAPLDTGVSLRAFRGRPESNLVQSYGKEVGSALQRAELGKWLPLETRDGWRALRLIAFTPGINTSLEAARDAVRRDFIEAAVTEKRAAAVRALWKNYEIQLEETIECLADKG